MKYPITIIIKYTTSGVVYFKESSSAVQKPIFEKFYHTIYSKYF